MATIKRAIGTINYRSVDEGLPTEFGGIAAVVDTVTDLRFFEEKMERGRSMSAVKNDKIVNGKLMKPLDKKLQIVNKYSKKRVGSADEEKKKRSLSRKKSSGF